MGMKEWVQRCQPVQLYLVLSLTVIVFLVELVVSHLTHALTLLMDSYHLLCNIIALAGCIITIKYGNEEENVSLSAESGIELKSKIKELQLSTREKTLKNTFGWARIDVIVMLICCVFLASLCFSLVVEALQTLVHINHQDAMHYPIPVMFVGAIGILLNGICYLLIGGYTFHQGSFLYVTASGDVVLNKVVTKDSVRQGERRLSRTQAVVVPTYQRQRQGFREMCRDTFGCFIVVITSIIVHVTDKEVAKYIDPSLAILSAAVLMYLSYPYMRESCLILLQTIPGSINIDDLKSQLLKAFPDIVNVHDLHVWQLTANKIISTAHIIFKNPKEFAKISEDIKEFFLEQGITQVTIQPEFKLNQALTMKTLSPDGVCLMKCQSEGCKNSSCCAENYAKSTDILDCDHGDELQSISIECNKQIEQNTNIPTEQSDKQCVVQTDNVSPIDDQSQHSEAPRDSEKTSDSVTNHEIIQTIENSETQNTEL